MPCAVHIVAASLRESVDPDALAHALTLAYDLEHAPGVARVVVARSDRDLLVATWLRGRADLEAFAESAAHMAFVMRGLAPVIRAMWSAAVETDAEPPTAAGDVLWVFALPEREGVYEWQIRRLLDDLASVPGDVAAGPTIEERERFRAGGVVLTGGPAAALLDAVDARRAAWGELVGSFEEAHAPVVPR